MKKYYSKFIVLFLFTLLCNACDSKTITDIFMKKPDMTGYDYSIFKISDTLILHPPAEYGQFWDKPEKYPALPKDLSVFPVIKETAFQFHVPNFTGHTAESIKLDFDKTRVDVIQISGASMDAIKPGAPGAYPPNVFSRNANVHLHLEKYEEKFGLRCYERLPPRELDQRMCYGKRDSDIDENILIYAWIAPYDDVVKFPTLRTHYFSPKYGGIEIAWRTHMNNFSKWREIDAQVWKFLDAWNVAPKQPNK
jgi:hypothetical protein